MDQETLLGVGAGVVVAGSGLAAAIRVRDTTAVPAAWWVVVAGVALAAERWAAAGTDDAATLACRRLAVVALAVCPGLALLGAKRPQHGVWQTIVATLAVVLMAPALTASLVRPGSLPDVHLLSKVLVTALVLVGWLNHAATRRGLAAAAIAVGQLLFARPLLPGGDVASIADDRWALAGAMVAAVGSALAALWPARVRPPRIAPSPAPPSDSAGVATMIDPAWRAFRDTFGAAWALRVAERFDATARDRGWPCRLGWRGITVAEPAEATRAGTTAWPREARRTLVALLRRFVGSAWLTRHGMDGAAGGAGTPHQRRG